LYCREQNGNDGCTYPGIEEELRTETPEQVGDASGLPDNLPHIRAIEDEKLVLLLIVQVMRIGQSEKEEDSHTEQTTYQTLY
jgi:hypothetical protein